MKIRILKGTDEIGGSCIEVSTENTSLLLDYGTPLKSESKALSINKHIDAILLSHPHQDHFGEIVNMPLNIPIFLGEKSLQLINSTRIFTGKTVFENNFQIFNPWEEFAIGDFTIKAFLVDHSAVDAYAFLISDREQTLLYSGDFRANGRKSTLFKNMCLDKQLKEVDLLIMEGTMMHRNNLDFSNEASVEEAILKELTSHNNLTFLLSSSQNIDRLVSAYRACKKAKKFFVVDIYTAWILEIASKKTKIPNISWEDIKVIKSFGGNYYQKIKENPNFFNSFTKKLFNDTVSENEITQYPSKYFIKISPHFIKPLLQRLNLETCSIIYSQWLGYLDEKHSDIKLCVLYKELQKNYNWKYAHTGGHADIESLKTFAKSLKPKALVPIHTEHKEDFLRHFDNVVILEDGEAYEIGQNLSRFQAQQLNKIFDL